MKSASVRELQHHLKKVLDVINHGEEIIITRRNTPIAKIVPLQKHSKRLEWPDFITRARLTQEPSRGTSLSESIIENRKERI